MNINFLKQINYHNGGTRDSEQMYTTRNFQRIINAMLISEFKICVAQLT